MTSYSQSMRDELAQKKVTRDEKLRQVFQRPAMKSALREAEREAAEARAAADRAKRELQRAKR
jgi:hypothetical protein